MRTGPGGRFPSRLRAFAAAALFLLCSRPSAPADGFAFLPAKDALRARQILSDLDATLAAWNVSERLYAAQLGRARSSLEEVGDSKAVKSLLEAGAAGTWKPEKGYSLALRRADALGQAKMLAAILRPRIDSADPAALRELYPELAKRAVSAPGAVQEYLDFAGRLAGSGAPELRFAVHAVLGLAPEEIALRLAPDGVDPVKLPYASNAELTADASGIRRLRVAREALRSALPILAVPELPWNEEEGAKAEEAARILSLVDPENRSRVLADPGLPGLGLLPAFLAGLSPEERWLWSRERRLSPGATDVFLACAFGPVPGGIVAAPESRTNGLDRARTLAELERDLAKGVAKIELLARLTDPALRLALRSPAAPPSLRSALRGAVDELASALEAHLSQSPAAAGGTATGPAAFIVETEEDPGPAGFTVFRAYRVSADGTETPVPVETLGGILESIAGGSPAGSTRLFAGAGIGLLAASGRPSRLSGPPDGSVPVVVLSPRSPLEGAENAALPTLASLSVYAYGQFLEEALAAGIPPAALLPGALQNWIAVCKSRCYGYAGDKEVEEALARSGGPGRLRELWKEGSAHLEWVKRALSVQVKRGGNP